MADLRIDVEWPSLTPLQSLMGWRREFCVELLGNGAARIFVRGVSSPSLKADELKRGVLFHRIETRFQDLEGFVAATRPVLEALADNAVRRAPMAANLFASITFDRELWERVVHGLERWQRQGSAPTMKVAHACRPT